jgi:hypothetical protein
MSRLNHELDQAEDRGKTTRYRPEDDLPIQVEIELREHVGW